MFDLATLTEFGLAGFTLAGFIAVSKWFLSALDKKDKLVASIVDRHEVQRERENERHDKSYNRLSEAINDLTVEIARKK